MMDDDECGAVSGILTIETEVLRENLPRCRFVHHKSNTIRSGLETGPLLWEAGDQPPELWHGPN
jgi:hypothetical protein